MCRNITVKDWSVNAFLTIAFRIYELHKSVLQQQSFTGIPVRVVLRQVFRAS